MQYKTIKVKIDDHEQFTKFDDRVNRSIEAGWEPIGGISISIRDMTGSIHAAQAMIKKD